MVTEAARWTERPDAFDYILRGRAAMSRPPTPEKCSEAVDLFDRAIAIDPASVEAQGWLAIVLANRALDYLTGSRAADLVRAETLTARAVAAAPRSALAHYARAELLRVRRRHDEAIPEYQTAIAANPNWADAIAGLGWCKFWSGDIDETIPFHERAIRLSPRDPNVGHWYFRIGHVHLLESRPDEAILWLERAARIAPGLYFVHSYLAAAYGLTGKNDRAAAELAQALRLRGGNIFSSIALLKAKDGEPAWDCGPANIRALCEATYFTGLRLAGLPEE
jgi:adenylate cyclase